jgi:hypothetical protein
MSQPSFRVLVVTAALAVAGATACTSATASGPGPAAETKAAMTKDGSAAAEPVVGPPQVAWKDMTKQQRGKYMRAVVIPKFKELFTAFDAKHFAKVECATCHGQGAPDRGFKMPNPDLYVLPGSQAEWGALMKEKPEWLKFMSEKVKPVMATLLGKEEFDPQNPNKPDTLGCHACHTAKGH